jgi:hypothetical protein
MKVLFNHKNRNKIMNDADDDIHPDIDFVLMDHVDIKEYMKETRFSIKDFLEAKEVQ